MNVNSDTEVVLNLESDFYEVLSSIKKDGAIWKAHAKIYRKDTHALINGGSFGAASTDKQEALDRLIERFELKKVAMINPPPDWGSVRPYQEIINFYREHREELSNYCFDLKQRFELDELDASSFRQGLTGLEEKTKEFTFELVRRIAQLSDEDKEGLLVCSEDVYNNIFKPSNLDEVYARKALFDYILKPTEKMIQLYKGHQGRVLKEFERQKI